MLFSAEEYQHRQNRIRGELEAVRLDALLVSGDDNITYFAGIRSLLPRLIQTRPLFVLIPVSQDPVVLIHNSRVVDTRVNSPISEHRIYSTSEEVPYGCAPVAELTDLLRARGLERGRIGVELGHDTRMGMPVGDFERLRARLPNAQFRDASDPIWNVRMRKSPAELELLKRSAEITGEARQRTFAQLKPGMTDGQVLNLFFREILEVGGDRPSFGFVAAGPLQPEIPLFGVPAGRPLEMGDLVCLDGGCWVQDYSCDYDRLAVLGRPSHRQKDLYQRLRDLNDKMLELFRPGVSTAEVYAVYVAECRRHKIPNPGVIVGHGMGMLLGEPPRVAPWDETVFEPGIVCSSEPYFLPADGPLVWEDLLVITESGHELLTTESPDLFVIN